MDQYIQHQLIIKVIARSSMKTLQQFSLQPLTNLSEKKIKSFRFLSQKSRSSDHCHSESSFSSEYHSLTRKLNIRYGASQRTAMAKNRNYFSTTAKSNFPLQKNSFSSFRVRTESMISKKKDKLSLDRSCSQHMGKTSQIQIVPLGLSPAHLKKKSNSFTFAPRFNSSPQAPNVTEFNPHSPLKSQSSWSNQHLAKRKPKKFLRVFQQSQYSLFNEDKGLLLTGELGFKKNMSKQSEAPALNLSAKKEMKDLRGNLQKLLLIHEQLTPNPFIRPKAIVKSIKQYVLNKTDGIKMETVMPNASDQGEFKQLLCIERCVLVCVLDLAMKEKIHNLANQCKVMLENIIGFYGSIFQQIGDKDSVNISNILKSRQIEVKQSLSNTVLYLNTKIISIFRFSTDLYHEKIRPIINSAAAISCNRAFYNLLTIFAAYLCEVSLYAQYPCSKYLNSFMTCPSPFIITPRRSNCKYTLILDLDETLVHTDMRERANQMASRPLVGKKLGTYNVLYRPYCQQLLQEVSQYYQIVIFTSSISEYAEEVVSSLSPHIGHVLCREHTIKSNGQTVKDLSRVGRSLESTLIVDNLPINYSLQKENGLPIRSWYGEQDDQQLMHLSKLLLEIAKKQPADIRVALKQPLKAPDMMEAGEGLEVTKAGFFESILKTFMGSKEPEKK